MLIWNKILDNLVLCNFVKFDFHIMIPKFNSRIREESEESVSCLWSNL